MLNLLTLYIITLYDNLYSSRLYHADASIDWSEFVEFIPPTYYNQNIQYNLIIVYVDINISLSTREAATFSIILSIHKYNHINHLTFKSR